MRNLMIRMMMHKRLNVKQSPKNDAMENSILVVVALVILLMSIH